MANLVKPEIKNFRGIKQLTLEFDHTQNIVCLIGRGDSGKSTVLEAISSVSSSSWNLIFHDTDFYNCDHANSIEIIAHLVDLPEKLMDVARFGLFLRNYNSVTKIISDDIEQIEGLENKALLSVKLVVDHTLEPE